MGWVPIHESGLDYSFSTDEWSNVAEMSESTISYTRVGSNSSAFWWLEFPAEKPLGIRITPTSYLAATGWQGAEFDTAYFAIEYDDDTTFVVNEAPPYPDSVLPNDEGITSWIPNPVVSELLSPVYSLTYYPTMVLGDGWSDRDESYIFLVEVWVDGPEPPPDECSFNCECDDPNPSRTLAELRTELMRRAGMSAMTANPPPGMPELLNSFLQSSQRMLYRQYPVLRTERFFTWNMVQGTRFYDLDANRDVCTKKLDARMLSWVGISDGCDQWRPLVCGIPPECYQVSDQQGVPYRYEIRQCIEVWPAPDSDAYKLRIKGDFGLEPFEADEDQCTIDDEAVFLHALARLKAHQGDPDARNYQQDAMDYIGYLTAGAHLTRRYVPGECPEPPLPKPIWVPKVY
jgi:hypothetical protein